MAEIGSWNGHRFVVTPTLIQSFSDLSIKGSSETEEKTGNGEKYVSRKNGKPFEVGMTVELNAYLGCKVKEEAMKLVEEAEKGESSYFYLAGKKLLPCKLMLVEAEVGDVTMSPGGIWIGCNVQLKMKQCSKKDTASNPASSGGGGAGSGSNNGGGKNGSINAAAKAVIAGAQAGIVSALSSFSVTSSGTSSFQKALLAVQTKQIRDEGRKSTSGGGVKNLRMYK